MAETGSVRQAALAGGLAGVVAALATAVLIAAVAARVVPKVMPRMMQRMMSDGGGSEAMRACMERCGCIPPSGDSAGES